MLLNANESARLVLFLDNSFIVSGLCASMTESDNLSSYAVRPFEVLSDFYGESFNITRRIGQRRSEIDRLTHLASESKSVRRESSLL